jgi:hypothetical protein
MTIGWIEGLIILLLIIIFVGLAFRSGFTRGRKRSRTTHTRRDPP